MGIGTAGGEAVPPTRPGRHLLAVARRVGRRRHGHPAQHHRSKDLGLFEVNEAAEIIQSAADPNANIIFAPLSTRA